MAFVLYYSSYCEQCNRLLRILAESPVQLRNQIHFISVDARRYDAETRRTLLVLDNGTQMVLPPSIQRVPAMICVTKGNRLVFGSESILNFLQGSAAGGGAAAAPPTMVPVAAQPGIQPSNLGVPSGAPPVPPGDITFHDFPSSIQSDKYSFLGSNEVMSMEGGGRSQQTIRTPAEDYAREKLGSDITIDKLIAKRNADIPPSPVPPSNMPGFLPALPTPNFR